MNWLKRRPSLSSELAWLGAGLLGLAWFCLAGGWRTLDARQCDWLARGDWHQVQTGWSFFRSEPWGWPLGAIRTLAHPVGTSLVFTDSIPWLALALKPLSRLLPVDFQYAGLWLAGCFFLQGFWGARIAGCFTGAWFLQLAAGALFGLSPVLFWRLGHMSLCAHWLLLVLFWLYLKSDREEGPTRASLGLAGLTVVFSLGVHAYLTAMLAPLALGLVALAWRCRRARSAPVAGLVLATMATGVLCWPVMAALGYFVAGTDTTGAGLGSFSADLTSLVNPAGMSAFLPPIRVGKGQYEGFGYLGVGVLLLAAFTLIVVRLPRTGPTRQQERTARALPGPLLVLPLLMALFALSPRVSFSAVPVLSLEILYTPIARLVNTFRSTGRFIWPLHYLVLVAVLGKLLRESRLRPWALLLALGSTLVLQVVEPWKAVRHPRFHPVKDAGRLRSRSEAQPGRRHLALVPASIRDGSQQLCGGPRTESVVGPLMQLAYRSGLSINSGYLTRVDVAAVRRYCAGQLVEIRGAGARADTVYFVEAAHVAQLEQGGARCQAVDELAGSGMLRCVR